MKKIMVHAYTKFNLGDDLFIKVLCERFPNTNFILYAPSKYIKCFNEITNLKCYSSESFIIRTINYFFRRFKVDNFFERMLAKSCDAGVYIGGSLFIQGENWEDYLYKYIKPKKIINKPFYLLGANFGPYRDKEYYDKYKEIFSEYTDICFREKYSFEMFKDLPNVRMADDIIFQLKKKNLQEQNNIVISVIKPSYRKNLNNYDEKYYLKIKDIALHFIEKGFNVTLMSFCEYEGDEEAIDKIMEIIPKEYLNKIKKHYYTINLKETLNIIAESKFVVATRFHSMILGWVYNKPVFPIVYSKKMSNVIEDVGFNGLYVNLKDIENVLPEKVFECINVNMIDVSKQVIGSEGHFRKLDEYIHKDII